MANKIVTLKNHSGEAVYPTTLVHNVFVEETNESLSNILDSKVEIGEVTAEGQVTVEHDNTFEDVLKNYYTKIESDNIHATINNNIINNTSLINNLKNSIGTASSKDVGLAAGNIPELDSTGRLPSSIIPAVAITDTFECSTQTQMLALTAEKGDICVRSDLNKSYILKTTPASTLSNWVELKTPTDHVFSVNGKTGTILLASTDLTDSNALARKTEVDAIQTALNTANNNITTNTTQLSNIKTLYTKLDGTNYYTQLSQPSDNNNVVGWRLFATHTLSSWGHASMALAIDSRHSGTGLLTFGICNTNGEYNTIVGSIKLYGSTDSVVNTNAWKMIYDKTTHEVKIYWKFYDYNTCKINVLKNRNWTLLGNSGEWLTEEPVASADQIEYWTIIDYVTINTNQTITGSKNFSEAKFPTETGGTDYRYPLTIPMATSTDKRYLLGHAGIKSSNRWTNINNDVYTQNSYIISKGIANSTSTRLTSLNFDHENLGTNTGQSLWRFDTATGSCTTGKPGSDGYVITAMWDNTGVYDAQFFLPNDATKNNGRPQLRFHNPTGWTTWTDLALLKDVQDSASLKASKDLSDVTYPTITSDGVARTGAGDRVIESYISSDKNTWYRKWASGWKECGTKTAGFTNANAKFTYPVTFTNIPTVTIGPIKSPYNSSTSAHVQEVTTQYTTVVSTSGYDGCFIHAEGY